MRQYISMLAVAVLGTIVMAPAYSDGLPGPCGGNYLTKKAFTALPEDQKKQELKRLSDALKMGCRSATKGLGYLLVAAPRSKAEAFSWYRLLVETAGTQSAQIQLQANLLDQFLDRIDEHTQTIQKLRKQQAELLQKASALLAERDDALLRVDRLTAKIGALNSRLKTASRLETARTSELAAMKKRLDGASGLYHKANQKVGTLETRLKAARQEMAELQKQHDAALAHGRKLQSQIDKLTTDLGSRAKDIQAAQARIAGLEQDVSTLQNNVSGLVDELAQRKQIINQLENQLKAQKDQLKNTRDAAAAKERDYKASMAQARQREQNLAEKRDALKSQIQELEARLKGLRADLQQARKKIDMLNRSIAQLDARRAELEKRVASQDEEITALTAVKNRLQGQLDDAQAALAATRDKNERLTERAKGLDAALADSHGREADAAARIKKLTDQIAGLELDRSALADQVNRLTGENASHRDDLQNKARVIRLLERDIEEKRAEIATLKQRARPRKPAESPVARFNDQLVRGLEKAFHGREGFSSDGKRFFVQAEILFKSGSAELSNGARRQLRRIADFTRETTKGIPSDVKWVLRVNGHTDIRKMRPGSRFADNWELSSQRALAVLRLFVKYGLPPDHLAAVGYGAFHPIARGKTAADFKRNRRIELRLVSQD